MNTTTSMLEQLRKLNNGDFKGEALFYDWFCKEESLPARSKKLVSFAKAIVTSPRFKAEECYLFFKNNSPVFGPTYDSLSVCRMSDGEVLYHVAFGDQRLVAGTCAVYGEPEAEGGSFKTLVSGNVSACIKFFV